jgi:glucose-1-phosphate cytidylyltransferase
MKNLSCQGVSNFVIGTGYKGEVIKDYFLNYEPRNNDITIDLGKRTYSSHFSHHEESDWKVTLVNTGESTQTGGRLFQSLKYIGNERFLCTYGDGLANINLQDLIRFHESHGKIATITTVRPMSRFGIMEVDEVGTVTDFREKPIMDGWINIGFFIFEPKIKEYLEDSCALEEEPLARLTLDRQLAAYRHDGFWQPMDTYREHSMLNDLWNRNSAPWKNW